MTKKLDSLFFLGRPFGPLYGLVMKVREQFYKKQIFKQKNPGVPVISVGNLVLGGTGKTPTVIYIANLLKKHGFKPAIISRGYGGKSKADLNIVSDGKNVLMDSVRAGDEPVLLSEVLENTPVLTSKKRILACTYAVQHFGVNIIVLDDGFQHMGVTRDINLVLFDATNLAGNSRIFPAGPLREPVKALNRSTAFLITGQNKENKKRSEAFAELIRSKFENTPVFVASNSQAELVTIDDVTVNPDDIAHAYIFCAIANPERVNITAESLGIKIVETQAFNDHNVYTQVMINNLCERAKKNGAKCLITTMKDFVKIKTFHFNLPLFILKINQEPEPDFNDYIINNIP